MKVKRKRKASPNSPPNTVLQPIHTYIETCPFVLLSDCFLVLQSTETLHELSDLETNVPSTILHQGLSSETQSEDFMNEEDRFDEEDDDDDFASFDS
jgi:hypothetical protein